MEIEQMSLIEVAKMLMEKKRTPQNIRKLIKEVLEIKGIADDDFDKITQLYLDITTCADFVHCDNDEWDLKERQPIEVWDKDGSSFNIDKDEQDDIDLKTSSHESAWSDDDEDEIKSDEDFDDDELDVDEFEVHDVDDDDELEITDAFSEDSFDSIIEDDDFEADDDYDEDKYNAIMDDFEDMYDK